MTLKAAISVFLALAILGLESEATTSQGNENGEAFTYTCMKSEILTLYNQSKDYVIAECSPIEVCNQVRACTPGPCGLQFSYINSVNRDTGGNIQTACCHLDPEPNGEESCTTVQVNDKHYLGQRVDQSKLDTMLGKPSPSKVNGQAETNANDMPKGRAIALKELQARRRRKRNGEADIVLPADVWLTELADRSASHSYLKKVESTPSGYSATLCTIQCNEANDAKTETEASDSSDEENDE